MQLNVGRATRTDIEDRLASLDSIDEVAWLRLGHDVSDAEVTALVTGFETRDGDGVRAPDAGAVAALGVETRLRVWTDARSIVA